MRRYTVKRRRMAHGISKWQARWVVIDRLHGGREVETWTDPHKARLHCEALNAATAMTEVGA